MNDTVKFSRLYERLDALDYPISREEAATACRGETLTFADGQRDLGDLLSGLDDARFEAASELHETLQAELPTEALGEPGQSDGDA
jgi:hypothetical protein